MSAKQAAGAEAESRAADFLAARGMKLLGRNFRVRGGEIDLICRDGASVVFVEVRSRSRNDYGGAAASITPAKQAKLILAARHWLIRHGDARCRFDCVLIQGGEIEWIRDAFRAD